MFRIYFIRKDDGIDQSEFFVVILNNLDNALSKDRPQRNMIREEGEEELEHLGGKYILRIPTIRIFTCYSLERVFDAQ